MSPYNSLGSRKGDFKPVSGPLHLRRGSLHGRLTSVDPEQPGLRTGWVHRISESKLNPQTIFGALCNMRGTLLLNRFHPNGR
jgi:hypothetical protein